MQLRFFCYGNNPISFDTISVGERISECEAYYVNDDNEDEYRGIPCPTLWQAQKWLREVKDCNVLAKPQIDDIGYTLTGKWYHEVWIDDNIFEASDTKDKYFDAYETALSAGIEAALKLIEENEI